MMKKIFNLFILVFLFLTLIGCEYPNDVSNENYQMHIVDSENNKIAIGDIKYVPVDGAAFIPYTIDGYMVSVLGIAGTLSLSNDLNNYSIRRIYLPSSIEKVAHHYLQAQMRFNIFFCNKPIELYNLYKDHFANESIAIYVPSEYYDGYLELNQHKTFYKANVCYYFNIEKNDYYYIDYYEEGSLIEFIPPIPTRDGYTFEGWYTEKECINKWDFESNTVKLDENSNEIKLYAKWI